MVIPSLRSAVVFAKVSRSSKEGVDAKYARGVYLGPVLGSTGHQVRIRLDSGETKLIVAPGLKLLYPLRYDASLLDGAKALEGFVPPLDEERFRELHLPMCREGDPQKNGSENTVAHRGAPAALGRPRPPPFRQMRSALPALAPRRCGQCS